MTCPNCGSKDWKAASFVHANGVATTSTTNVGVGIAGSLAGGPALGSGIVASNGKQQTELAKLCAPPTKAVRPVVGAIVLGVIWIPFAMTVIFSSIEIPNDMPSSTRLVIFLVSLGVAFGPIFIALRHLLKTPEITKKNEADYVLAMAEYGGKRVCMRCGTIYVVKGDEEFGEDGSPSTSVPIQADSSLRKCPYCAETIKVEAIFCRYCNHELGPAR